MGKYSLRVMDNMQEMPENQETPSDKQIVLVTDPIDPALPVDSPMYNLDEKIYNLVSKEALERKIEDLTFQYAYPLCMHIWVNNKQKVEICTNKAGLFTSHEGKGRCAKHEGMNFETRSPYVQHLRGYSTLQEIFEQFENREKRLQDLSEEVSVARTILSMQLKRFEKGKNATNDAVFDKVLNALEVIRRIVDTISKVQHSEAVGITLQSITAFLWQISEILNQEVQDPRHRIRILDRIALETSFGG